MPVTLFISYSRKNHVLVYRLRRELEALGAKIWIDHTRLKPGTPDWDQAIRDGIQASELVIYAASPAARRSPFVRDELQVAKQFGKTIIPFWLDGEHWIDSAPLGMGSVQYVDARGKLFDSAVAQLAAVCGLRAPGAASTGVKPPTA